MATNAVVSNCILSSREDLINRFDAKPGTLNLKLKDVIGSTHLVSSTVTDIADSAPTAVSHTRGPSGISFEVEAGKIYHVALAFVQNASASVAELEGGGLKIFTIDAANLYPGFVVYA